jgi:hypothetical protein
MLHLAVSEGLHLFQKPSTQKRISGTEFIRLDVKGVSLTHQRRSVSQRETIAYRALVRRNHMSRLHLTMSALAPKADMCSALAQVR